MLQRKKDDNDGRPDKAALHVANEENFPRSEDRGEASYQSANSGNGAWEVK